MAGEKCPACGSTETIRHVAESPIKPNWLHCNKCARCADTPAASKRSGRGKADAASDEPGDGESSAGEGEPSAGDTVHD